MAAGGNARRSWMPVRGARGAMIAAMPSSAVVARGPHEDARATDGVCPRPITEMGVMGYATLVVNSWASA